MTKDDELMDFAKNSKFKTVKSNTYTFFNINEEKQIRIYRTQTTMHNSIKYRVTLHSIDDDVITYKPYELNTPALSLIDAKLIAAKYYFQVIRS